jgi:CheY-like chemotaxis protein
VSDLPDGTYICLSVTDSGVGMNEETLSRAMEPFYTTKQPGQGTGLGLSMVHGMAMQAGGRLVLKSELEKGTIAELWLPIDAAGVSATNAASASRPVARTSLTILAVDDDPLVLLNTVTMLEDLGHGMFEASSGKKALEVLAREPSIELVVTDMAMPQMNGLKLVEFARALYPKLRFVLATGYAEAPDDDQPELLRLKKPFWQDDLAKAVRKAAEG